MMLSFRCSAIFGMRIVVVVAGGAVGSAVLRCVLRAGYALLLFVLLLLAFIIFVVAHCVISLCVYEVVRQATIRRFFDITGFGLTE